MANKEDNDARPPIIARTAPAARCFPCAARLFTEWTITHRRTAGIIATVYETTAQCNSYNRGQTFKSRELTAVGRPLAAVPGLLPEPPTAQPAAVDRTKQEATNAAS